MYRRILDLMSKRRSLEPKKESNLIDDSTQVPLPSASGFTSDQRGGLAKVYRFLLKLHNHKTDGDESSDQASPRGLYIRKDH
jgi:hypothetical protein